MTAPSFNQNFFSNLSVLNEYETLKFDRRNPTLALYKGHTLVIYSKQADFFSFGGIADAVYQLFLKIVRTTLYSTSFKVLNPEEAAGRWEQETEALFSAFNPLKEKLTKANNDLKNQQLQATALEETKNKLTRQIGNATEVLVGSEELGAELARLTSENTLLQNENKSLDVDVKDLRNKIELINRLMKEIRNSTHIAVELAMLPNSEINKLLQALGVPTLFALSKEEEMQLSFASAMGVTPEMLKAEQSMMKDNPVTIPSVLNDLNSNSASTAGSSDPKNEDANLALDLD